MTQDSPSSTEEMRGSTPLLEDPVATRHALREWFCEQHPQAHAVHIGELEIPQANGMSNITATFQLSWGEAGSDKRHERRCVARLQPAQSVFPEYELGSQYRIMQSLAAHSSIPVPPLLGAEQSSTRLGTPFFIMQYVDGLIPTDIPPYHMGGWLYESATPTQRHALWRLGIEHMATLHRLDYRTLDVDFLHPPKGMSPLQQQLDYWQKFLHWGLDGAPYPLAEEALQWLRHHAPSSEPTTLCWGDARLGNMIFAPPLEQPKVAALLDWEMARIGNPVQDLAWWHLIDDSFWRGLQLDRLEGLPPPAEDIALWQQQSGHSAQDHAYYYLLAACKFTLVMSRIMYLQKQPEEQMFDHFVAQLLRKILRDSG